MTGLLLCVVTISCSPSATGVNEMVQGLEEPITHVLAGDAIAWPLLREAPR